MREREEGWAAVESVSIAELWNRVSATQPDPPDWVMWAAAAAALLAVLWRPLWRPLRTVVTMAHEGGHAVAALLVGRRLQGIRLHTDTSGVTVSSGRPTGPGMVFTAAAGYPAPSLLGAGGAALLGAGRVSLTLWVTLALLALLLLSIRNLYGAFAVVALGAVVFGVSQASDGDLQAAFAYLLVWFLLLSGVRPVIELQQTRRGGRASWSDADQLATLTRLPGIMWVGFFAVVALACLASGAGRLIP